MNTVGKKLLWGIGLPALILAVTGVVYFWRQADRAVRESLREEAVALSELITTSFAAGAGAPERDRAGNDRLQPQSAVVHQAVVESIRGNPKILRHVSELRVVDRQGVVRWSKRIEEEGRPVVDFARLSRSPVETVALEESGSPLPFLGEGTARAEVIRPLGGMACAGCHTGESTMRVGVLQLVIDSPELRREVGTVFRDALASILVFMVLVAAVTAASLRLFLTRPLRRLAQAMRRAEEGDFLARADAHQNDEIGRLSAAFNGMLVQITSMKAEEIDTHRDLRAAQEQLELKKALEETNSKLHGRVTELTTLYDVARSLSSTLELGKIFERICQIVPERLGIPHLSISLLEESGQLEVKAAHPNASEVGSTFKPGEGAAGKAAETQKSVYVSDLSGEVPIFPARGDRRSRGSVVCVPMVHGGSLLGVLQFGRSEKDGFSTEEIDLLTALADQAALAVKNAQLHQATVELSITDPLTQVPNRRHLISRLELELARANRFGIQVSLVMIDIDYFKHLNDAAGHRAGDKVLVQVSELLKGMVRRVDTLGRYGGEEFAVVLPQVTKAEAVEVAEKLRRSVEETRFEHGSVQPLGKVTISVGVANLPVDATDQERLIDCADSALYASKRGGRNRVTAYAAGMELHPGRERGPHARRLKTGEHVIPALAASDDVDPRNS